MVGSETGRRSHRNCKLNGTQLSLPGRGRDLGRQRKLITDRRESSGARKKQGSQPEVEQSGFCFSLVIPNPHHSLNSVPCL